MMGDKAMGSLRKQPARKAKRDYVYDSSIDKAVGRSRKRKVKMTENESRSLNSSVNLCVSKNVNDVENITEVLKQDATTILRKQPARKAKRDYVYDSSINKAVGRSRKRKKMTENESRSLNSSVDLCVSKNVNDVENITEVLKQDATTILRKQPARKAKRDYVYDSCIDKVVGRSRKRKVKMTENELRSSKSSVDFCVSKNVNDVENITEVLKQDATTISIQRFNFVCFEDEGKQTKDWREECFKPLTKEEKREVICAFQESNTSKVLVSHENSTDVTGKELQCLKPREWLSNVVINLYLELLKERQMREPQKFLKCHFFSSLFYTKMLWNGGRYNFQLVQKWTIQEKLEYSLLECDKIFVPIHQEDHWCLAVINKKEEKFQYLDSLIEKKNSQLPLNREASQALDMLAMYYVDEVKDKNGKDIDVSSWEREIVVDLPKQENGYDCGVFMIKYIDFYSRGVGLRFSQKDMPYFRKRTTLEILNLKAA